MKYKYEQVKEFIEITSESGCKLLSLSYSNCKNQLLFKCPCGNNFTTTFDNFKNSNKRTCDICVGNNYELRLKLDDAQNYCKEHLIGYEILDLKHVDSGSRNIPKVLVKCPDSNHKPYWVNWNNIKRGRRCFECYHKQRDGTPTIWTEEKIIQLLNEYELKPLSNDFKHPKKKILCMNNDGYFVNVNIMTLTQGMIPSPFMRNKYAIKNLKKLCSKFGLTLIENQKWLGIKNKYNAIDDDGYKFKINPETLSKGSLPYRFSSNNPYTIDNIKLYCLKNRPDYTIVSKKYINYNKYLKFKYVGIEVNMVDNERYFNVPLGRFLCNQGHPLFSQSKGEYTIEKWLLNQNILYERQYKFNDCKDKGLLKFDFAVFNNDKLIFLIEFQGIQHYEPVEYFGGLEKFEDQNHKDNIKRLYCEKNNIKLLEISYIDYDNIESILNDSLQQVHRRCII